MMSYETLIFEKKGAVAIVTLNRPAKKNALTEQMHRELIRVCNEVEKSDELEVLVLTGGTETFCAGADLADVSKANNVGYKLWRRRENYES